MGADPAGDREADAALAEHGAALADAVEAALPRWSVRVVDRLVVAFRGEHDPLVAARAEEAGRAAAAALAPPLRALLAADVDEQRTNPLAIIREAVRWPTDVLREAGVPPVVRDEHDEQHFPEDAYGLTPMTFADVDPDLHDAGILWGALKARAHLSRHRGDR